MSERETEKERADRLAPLERLREPFPAGVIQTLPRGNVRLEYVGHADLTDRLLTVDPLWEWEPFAVDEYGLPAVRAVGDVLELWIRLTVCGHTRIGVGTCIASKQEATKELIGDALRNAAMRFGAALDLWSKSDRLESQLDGEEAGESLTPARRFVNESVPDGDHSRVGYGAPPAPAREPLDYDERTGVSAAETYKKRDLLAFKPDGMGEGVFMRAVVGRAQEMSPTENPDLRLTSWPRLQRRAALVREIVDQIESGQLHPDGTWGELEDPWKDNDEGES